MVKSPNWANYFNFTGRATRLEFSIIFIITSIAYWVPYGLIPYIFLFIFNISTRTKRLHDLGVSGWIQVPFLIFGIIGHIILFRNILGIISLLIFFSFNIFLMWKEGQKKDNQYGPTFQTPNT